MKYCYAVIVSVFMFVVYSDTTYANEPSFTVTPLFPEEQIDGNESYYELQLDPTESTEFEVVLHNLSSKEVTVNASLFPAVTNEHFVIDYIEAESEIADLIDVEPSVTLGPHEVKTIDVAVQVPDQAFDGFLLGGLYFEEAYDENITNGGISNEYAYLIGLQLTNDHEQHGAIEPELSFINVEPITYENRPRINVSFQNDTAIIIDDLTVVTEIFTDEGERIASHEKVDGRMAPSSAVTYGVELSEVLKPGTYTANVTATNDVDEWVWEEELTIEEEDFAEAEMIEEESTGPFPYWMMIMMVVAILFVPIAFISGRRGRS
ncbi:WxL protein host-binding domain-containing protein [Geomicrobium sediminis]|uniref:DUF3324 domain-containing protein n=1 Tax=Geomicrobium sediminis TaxID=1347788 RepID=A0ABS2PAK7_9BACL|nr:hypothetical protein [Geomicrobium sediminis]